MRIRLSVFLPALAVLAFAPLDQANSAARPAPAPKRLPRSAPAPAPAVPAAKLKKQADLVVRCIKQRNLPRNIPAKQRAILFQVVREGRAGNVEQMEARWGELIGQMKTAGIPMDINALVQWTLREAYLETNKDLQFYADKVRYYNEQKKQLRDHIRQLRNTVTHMGFAEPEPVPTIKLQPYRKYAPATIKAASKPMRKADLDNYIKDLEEKLATVGDDAKLANVDLQGQLQKQQQALQTMSALSKSLHDAAMAIIRKIG